MTTDVSVKFEAPAVEYNVTMATITQWAADYLPLAVTDLKDKQQLLAVHSALQQVRQARIDTEKLREELKAPSLAHGRLVDKVAKQIKEALAPIERHLNFEYGKVEAEKERQRAELAAAVRAITEERVAKFAAVNRVVSYAHAEQMTEELFQADLLQATDTFQQAQRREAERQAQLAEQEAANRREAERLAAERAEQEKVRQAQADAQAKLDRAQRELEAKAREEQRLADLKAAEERGRKEAEARLVAQAEHDAAREAEEAKQAELARKRKEAMAPDKEKIDRFADTVAGVVALAPKLSTQSETAERYMLAAVNEAVRKIRIIAASL